MFLNASLLFLWCPEAEALIRSSIPLNIVTTFTIDQTLNIMVSWGAQKSNAMELALDFNLLDVHRVDFEVCPDAKFSNVSYHPNSIKKIILKVFFTWLRLQIF